MKRIIFLFLSCGLAWFSGCGEKLPSDFPTVHPMTLTVTDGTTPLSEVRVIFYPASTGAGASYAPSGATDATGTAKITTSHGAFTKEGIPAGDYVVTLEDIINFDDGISPEEKVKMPIGELNKLSEEKQKKMAAYKRKVPEALCQSGKIERRSPIRFTAVEGPNELAIDISQYKK